MLYFILYYDYYNPQQCDAMQWVPGNVGLMVHGASLPVLLIKPRLMKSMLMRKVARLGKDLNPKEKLEGPHPSRMIAFLGRLQSCFVDRKPKEGRLGQTKK